MIANPSPRAAVEPPRARKPRWRCVWIPVACLAVAAGPAQATVVTDLYEATVSTDRGQTTAFQDAMREVIVRVTGERDGDSAPALADLISGAQRYVQKYRNLPGGKVTIGFDGVKVESVIAAAGRPVWGRERPVTLVWLAIDDSGGRRHIVAADDNNDVKAAIDAAADSRGLPLLWPRFDTADGARVAAADVWSGSMQRVVDAGTRYRADAVLVGKLSSGVAEWTVLAAGETREVRGDVADGVHALADRLAQLLAASSEEPLRSASLDIVGVDSLAAYADLVATLEASSLVRSVAVKELAGERVVLAVSVRGAPDRLRRALAAQRKFQPLDESTADPSTVLLRYRP